MKIKCIIASLLFVLPAAAQTNEVLLETTEGNIRVMLYDDTPLHRDNFLKLVDEQFYDSLLFHRVIRNFMIQAGDPKSKHAESGEILGGGDLGYTLPAEIKTPTHYHARGTLAMAREGDARLEAIQEKVLENTKGQTRFSSEMYWTYKKRGGSPHLDGQYTVFGEVTEGLDVVEKIQKVFTDDYNRPVDDVRIIRATSIKR